MKKLFLNRHCELPEAGQHIRHWWNLLGHCERSKAIQSGLPRSRWSLDMTSGFTLAESAMHVAMSNKIRRFAFTLAEVLITLAIIGIVAALTIPTLVANYQKKALVVQLQKTYATIANAAKMVMADEQVDNLNNTYLNTHNYDDLENPIAPSKEDYENSVGKFLKTYFKVVKTCNRFDDNINECIADNYSSLDGNKGYLNTYSDDYCGVLSNGAVICLEPFNNTASYPIIIAVDVNGKNGPNIVGRDAFNFAMNYRGELAENFSKEDYAIEDHKPENCASSESSHLEYGAGCLTKIIQDGWKMDY